jgi:deoxyribodipyrimidine photo-lyase
MKQERLRKLNEKEIENGPVIYWMSRDQRASDNWALLYAQSLALKQKVPLGVIFCLVSHFLQATIRQYDFMLRGLEETEQNLSQKNIPLFLLTGPPDIEIPAYMDQVQAGTLVTDFDPLRIKRKWKRQIIQKLDVLLCEVDGHNIIPCWVASPKQEFAAYTFRPKVKKQFPDFLDSFPLLKKHPFSWKMLSMQVDWKKAREGLDVDNSVPPVDGIDPGEAAAKKTLRQFISQKLAAYDSQRNDPNRDALSNLSPYLHFGQISAQRVALEVRKAGVPEGDREAFQEELIVRRELADNYCYYNKNYDNFSG